MTTPSTALWIVGAGPAGLAAAAEAAGLGLRTVVSDENREAGGQIWRGVEAVAAHRPGDLAALGDDYARGLAAVRAARDCGENPFFDQETVIDITGDNTVIGTRHDRLIGWSRARQVIVATGALERPVPIPGWTLPGVMTAGAAQVLLKSAGMVPQGEGYVAGSGPLALLVALQLARAGVRVRAVLETAPRANYPRALAALPMALATSDLRAGFGLLADLRRAGVPVLRGVRGLAALGDGRLEVVEYRRARAGHREPADWLLLHEGVVPNVQLTRLMGLRHEWDARQHCWRPAVDRWGATMREGVYVAGDGAGIGGVRAAEAAGRLAALQAARRMGRITESERDARARPYLRARRQALRIRPFLDALYRPAPEMLAPPDDDVIVCRCEEVTAGAIRAAVADGAAGPNQARAFTRCGMGPCQGRMCGLTVAGVIAQARGVSIAEVGAFTVRAPLKPVPLGLLARDRFGAHTSDSS